jgi:hypothetical protein
VVAVVAGANLDETVVITSNRELWAQTMMREEFAG